MVNFLLVASLCLTLTNHTEINEVYVDTNNNNDLSRESLNSNSISFSFIGTYSNYAKVIDEEEGYVYYNIFIYKAPFTDRSDLYLFHCDTRFTPGHAAYNAGFTDYLQNEYLSKGTVSMHLKKYIDEDNDIESSSFAYKASWPASSPIYTQISSSYSYSINSGYTTGVSLGLTSGLSFYIEKYTETSISVQTDITTLSPDPTLSHQFSPEDPYCLTRNFTVQDKEVAGKLTYNLSTVYLFEMDNYSYSNCNRDAFIMRYEVNLNTCHKVLWWFSDSETFKYSVQINCFLN